MYIKNTNFDIYCLVQYVDQYHNLEEAHIVLLLGYLTRFNIVTVLIWLV